MHQKIGPEHPLYTHIEAIGILTEAYTRVMREQLRSDGFDLLDTCSVIVTVYSKLIANHVAVLVYTGAKHRKLDEDEMHKILVKTLDEIHTTMKLMSSEKLLETIAKDEVGTNGK